MIVEYEDVVNPGVSRKIHRWRGLRNGFEFGIWVFLAAGLASLFFHASRIMLIFFLCMIMFFILRMVAHFFMLRVWVLKDQVVCPECQYDLHAHEVARCPECGYEFGDMIQHEYERLRQERK